MLRTNIALLPRPGPFGHPRRSPESPTSAAMCSAGSSQEARMSTILAKHGRPAFACTVACEWTGEKRRKATASWRMRPAPVSAKQLAAGGKQDANLTLYPVGRLRF